MALILSSPQTQLPLLMVAEPIASIMSPVIITAGAKHLNNAIYIMK
jgi:hypothetical protein